jgi:hypothetical protein
VKRSLAVVDSREAAEAARRAVRARTAEEVHAILAPIAEAMHHAAVARPAAAHRHAGESV